MRAPCLHQEATKTDLDLGQLFLGKSQVLLRLRHLLTLWVNSPGHTVVDRTGCDCVLSFRPQICNCFMLADELIAIGELCMQYIRLSLGPAATGGSKTCEHSMP